MLEPSVAVQQKAHAACVERKFDRVFMTSLSFENDQATAVFISRGVDPESVTCPLAIFSI